MKNLSKITSIFIIVIFTNCVGTDFIDDSIIGEKLTILPRIDSLSVGKEQAFSVKFTNKYGIEEKAKNVTWRSSDPSKVSIEATGKAKALAVGKATIYATNGMVTDSIVLNKLAIPTNNNTNNTDTTFIKRGVFKTVNSSYRAAGNVRLQTVKGIAQIVTDTNFSTSAGPSLYLLLANHTDGRYTVTPGGNAVSAVSVQITTNKLLTFSGVQTWTVPLGVNPEDYKYIVLYCTLGPVFGAAELK
jgi:Bacterial Ig-like domain (group 2)